MLNAVPALCWDVPTHTHSHKILCTPGRLQNVRHLPGRGPPGAEFPTRVSAQLPAPCGGDCTEFRRSAAVDRFSIPCVPSYTAPLASAPRTPPAFVPESTFSLCRGTFCASSTGARRQLSRPTRRPSTPGSRPGRRQSLAAAGEPPPLRPIFHHPSRQCRAVGRPPARPVDAPRPVEGHTAPAGARLAWNPPLVEGGAPAEDHAQQ